MSNQDETEKDNGRIEDTSHIHFIDTNLTNRAPMEHSFLLDPVLPSSELAASTNNATATGNPSTGASASAPTSQIQIGTPWLTNTATVATNGVMGTAQSQAPTVSQLIQQQFQSLNPTNVVQQSQPQTIVHNQHQHQLNLFNTATIFQPSQQTQPLPGTTIQPQTTKGVSDQLRQVQVSVQPQHQQPAANIFGVQPQQLYTASNLSHPTIISPQFQRLNNIPLAIPNVVTQSLPSTVAFVSIPPPTTSINTNTNASINSAQTNKRKRNISLAAAAAPKIHPTSPEEEKSNSITSSTSSSGTLSGLITTVGPTLNFGMIQKQPHVANRSLGAGSSCTPNTTKVMQNKRARQKSPGTTHRDATSTVVTANSISLKKVEDMTPEERRRHERNTREQQRSHKISQQIKELRNVLSESKVPFKQNKYSILMSVVDYIKQLQQRAGLLDNEHNKLVNTIQQTNEMVKMGMIDQSDMPPGVGNDVELLCARGLDYKAIYEKCSIPLGVAALDGRLLMCNPKFEEWTGLSKQDLESRTLFGLLSASIVDEAFHAMGTMLKNKGDDRGQGPCNKNACHTGGCVSDTITETDVGTKGSSTHSGGDKPSDESRSDGSGDGSESGSGSGTSAHKTSHATSGESFLDSSDSSGEENITNFTNGKDLCVGYWCGALPPPREDIQMNISVTRTADGMPKFFSCALSLIGNKRDKAYDDEQ